MLAINLLLSLLSLLWACRGPFSLFHIIYYPWFAFSLFLGFFKPIQLFKTHLFISWACDPLFLLLGLNGFFIRLLTPFCPCCWASSSHLGFQNGPQQYHSRSSAMAWQEHQLACEHGTKGNMGQVRRRRPTPKQCPVQNEDGMQRTKAQRPMYHSRRKS